MNQKKKRNKKKIPKRRYRMIISLYLFHTLIDYVRSHQVNAIGVFAIIDYNVLSGEINTQVYVL